MFCYYSIIDAASVELSSSQIVIFCNAIIWRHIDVFTVLDKTNLKAPPKFIIWEVWIQLAAMSIMSYESYDINIYWYIARQSLNWRANIEIDHSFYEGPPYGMKHSYDGLENIISTEFELSTTGLLLSLRLRWPIHL